MAAASDDEDLVVDGSRTGRVRAWSRPAPDVHDDGASSLELDEDLGDIEPSQRHRGLSVASGAPLERSGFMVKKSGAHSGYRRRFFVLPPCGTLLWFKTEKDKDPAGFCHLHDVTIVEHRLEPSRLLTEHEHSRAFTLKSSRKDYLLLADDEHEAGAWLRALGHNRKHPPHASLAGASPASEKAGKQRMLGRVLLQGQQAMVRLAITSELGKKLLRQYCLPETFALLQGLRNLANLDLTLPARSGVQIENTILRLSAQVVVLLMNRKLRRTDMDAVESAVDTVCLTLVRGQRELRAAQAVAQLDGLEMPVESERATRNMSTWASDASTDDAVSVTADAQSLLGAPPPPPAALLPSPPGADKAEGANTSSASTTAASTTATAASTSSNAVRGESESAAVAEVVSELSSSLSARLQTLRGQLVTTLNPVLSPSSQAALADVMDYFGSAETLARFASDPKFAPDLDAIATITADIYGITGSRELDGDGRVELRECTVVPGRSPKAFRVVVLGIPRGASVFCILPCCSSLVQLTVSRRARGIIFPQSPVCIERCGNG